LSFGSARLTRFASRHASAFHGGLQAAGPSASSLRRLKGETYEVRFLRRAGPAEAFALRKYAVGVYFLDKAREESFTRSACRYPGVVVRMLGVRPLATG
jgi:hypothetical protein